MADGEGAVLLTFGTRPEAVKMAPVVRALNASSTLRPVVCLTGQHGEMVGQILPIFEVRPDFNLSIMAEDQTPSQVAAAVFTELPRVLAEVRPEILLVQGDTTTAMAAAVAGHYAKLPVGHVEAGLRTGNLFHPFPEEANRKIISAVSTLHFAPTDSAAANLRAEAIPEHAIHVTGNTVVDALHFLLDRQEAVAMPERRLILVTAHRRENFGEPLERICRAVEP
jgi:UDP-N-acetylglucosamine 2-epimerase